MKRCVNIDWLECYCLEDSIGFPHNADYFRRKGFDVKEREYGTPMYKEMFTLYDHFNEPFIEVRRAPKSSALMNQGLFSPYAAHVRLTNRACYATEAAKMMQAFLDENGFWFQRISRIDICLDFEYFDYGDDPKKFLERFMKGRYSKINQANISAHGLDQWDGRAWNSVHWGAPSSMVATRFYNKSMELKQVHDKPYIRQAWQACGLVDDMHTMEKKKRDGTKYKPEIWRVEFAVKSGTKKWFVVEDYNGDRKRLRSKKNTLDVYYTRQQLFTMFLSLAHHYFHFKVVEFKRESKALTANALAAVTIDENHPIVEKRLLRNRELQRKDRCRDKDLFRFDAMDEFYQIEKLAAKETGFSYRDKLLFALIEYRNSQVEEKVRAACNVVIEKLEMDVSRQDFSHSLSKEEIEVLRRVIAIRMKDNGIDVSEAIANAKEIVGKEKQIWLNLF